MEPELDDEAREALDLWFLIASQVRYPALGGSPYALDLAAVVAVFQAIGVQDIKYRLRQMLYCFSESFGAIDDASRS